MSYNTVSIDEDELECLRKLGEHPSSRSRKVFPQDHDTVADKYKMVRIDEDELENLLKSEENTRIVVVDRPNYNVRSSNNNEKIIENKKYEDINESAENFIQSFKQQLLLQRLESIENNNADIILARGL
ncbi:hypothetical protein vseg_007175 [Gypsophila vaccaria]